MCGIAGKLYFNQNKRVSSEEILAMTRALAHRGPDDEGIFVNKNIGLGHRRLSIIDLSPAGHQPMSDNSGKYWITFNGEIYNFQELRRGLEQDGVKFKSQTDTEVIIYLYKKYGVGCLDKLRGMFAFAIWDENKKQLFAARDRLGKKPFKFYYDKEKFIFASELKAILKNNNILKEIDYGAIDEYLTFGYVPAPKTGFKNIWKLEPAHYLIIHENGKMEKKRYWDIDFSKKLNLTEDEWIERIETKLKESVKTRLISDVPLGAHLSGGIDSGLIVALMSEQMSKPVKTYSIGFAEKEYNELPYAKLVAEKYATEHHEIIVEPNALEILPKLAYHYEEPFADWSAMPTWYLCQATRQGLTVALNGDGGDEAFGGYFRYQAVRIYELLHRLPGKKLAKITSQWLCKITDNKNIRRASRLLKNLNQTPLGFYGSITSIFSNEEKQELYTEEFKSRLNDSRAEYWYADKFKLITANDLRDKIMCLGINTHLSDQLLVKVDIASMAHGLEVRSPLLDHELLELTAQMPANLKVRLLDKKYLLKKIARRYLPAKCVDRPKKGFDLPVERWFSDKLNNFAKERLLSKEFLDLGFDQREIEKLLLERKNGGKDSGKKIWALLMIATWFEWGNQSCERDLL